MPHNAAKKKWNEIKCLRETTQTCIWPQDLLEATRQNEACRSQQISDSSPQPVTKPIYQWTFSDHKTPISQPFLAHQGAKWPLIQGKGLTLPSHLPKTRPNLRCWHRQGTALVGTRKQVSTAVAVQAGGWRLGRASPKWPGPLRGQPAVERPKLSPEGSWALAQKESVVPVNMLQRWWGKPRYLFSI